MKDNHGKKALFAILCALAFHSLFAAEPAFVSSREAQVKRAGELPSKADLFTIAIAGKAVPIDAAGNIKGSSGLKLEAKELEIFFITDVQYATVGALTILSVDFSNGDYVTGAFYALANGLDKRPELLALSPRIKAGQFATNGKYAFEATHDSYRLIDVEAKKIVYEKTAVSDGDLRYDTRVSWEGNGAVKVSFYHYAGADRELGTAIVDVMTGKVR
jgi:hypothetical protein